MVARILIVDNKLADLRALEGKLSAEYYDVLIAQDAASALEMAAAEQPDLVLLEVMLRGMDGIQVCRRLKENPDTRHIPVVLITPRDGRVDRLTGLGAGADDFLSKPFDDVMLMARVQSLMRLKTAIDELREREASGRRMGVIAGAATRLGGGGGRLLIVDDNLRQAQRVAAELAVEHHAVVETEIQEAALKAHEGVDLVIVNAAARAFDGLRFAAQLRSDGATRHLPILAVVDADERHRIVKALELGINDIVTRPIDPGELAARVRTQMRRKRYSDYLRSTLDHSLELAVIDGLTGLHNRRYLGSQMGALFECAAQGDAALAFVMIDIDDFKAVNDAFGHDVGSEALQELAIRLASNVRAVDLLCHYGGDEFAVVMPDTDLEGARRIAERIRLAVAAPPFAFGGTVTVSVGVASRGGPGDSATDLLKRADLALYEAKSAGRNRVIACVAD